MKNDIILLDHGSGGKVSHNLITGVLLPAFNNSILSQLNDSAVLLFSLKRLSPVCPFLFIDKIAAGGLIYWP